MDPNNTFSQNTNPNPPYSPFAQPASVAPVSSGTGAKPKKPLALIISLVAVALIALGVGVYLLFFNEKTSPFSEAPNEEPLAPAEVVYVAPEDDDGTGLSNFIEEKIEETASSGNETESFRYKMMALNLKTEDGEYDAVLSELNSYTPASLSAEERFMLYNTYSRVYEATGDTEKYDEYYNLALSAREEYVFGEN